MSKKISQLPLLETLTGNEEFPITYAGNNYKVTYGTIRGSITKRSIGLDKVDNTADIDKQVSIPQQLALNAKADLAALESLADTVDNKSDKDHKHTLSEITDIDDALGPLTQDVSDNKNSILSVTNRVNTVETRLDNLVIPTEFPISSVIGLGDLIGSLTTEVNSKASAVHSHSVNQILGIDERINSLIDGKRFALIGTMDW